MNVLLENKVRYMCVSIEFSKGPKLSRYLVKAYVVVWVLSFVAAYLTHV